MPAGIFDCDSLILFQQRLTNDLDRFRRPCRDKDLLWMAVKAAPDGQRLANRGAQKVPANLVAPKGQAQACATSVPDVVPKDGAETASGLADPAETEASL